MQPPSHKTLPILMEAFRMEVPYTIKLRHKPHRLKKSNDSLRLSVMGRRQSRCLEDRRETEV